MHLDRCKKLFSDFNALQNLKILICGVGGVGGYALECLYKSGVKNITIVDYDTFEITNQNRQIGSECLGEKKVDVLLRKYPGINGVNLKITPQNLHMLNLEKYDIVIDAIDDLNAKIALILEAYPKIISSMGAAKRVDPTKIRIDSIWKTQNDPFAKKVRDRLKKAHFKGDFKAVYSIEKPIACDMGSFVGVTGAFGFALCSEAVRRFV